MFFKIVILTLCIVNNYAEFPTDDIDRCVVNDLDCIVKAANDFVRRFKDGYPKLEIPKLDPYIVQNFTFDQDAGRPISLSFFLKSAEIIGLSTQNFEKAVGWGPDVSKSKYEFYGNIPSLEIKGRYQANGRILFAPIQGNGDFHLILEKIKGGIKFKPVSIERNGLNYLKMKKVKVLLEPSDMKIKLTNLFNNNEELGASLNELLNTNWRQAWDELAPSLLDITGDVIREILQPFLDKYNYDDYFLYE